MQAAEKILCLLGSTHRQQPILLLLDDNMYYRWVHACVCATCAMFVPLQWWSHAQEHEV